jgi:hypothetical protein
MSISTCAYPVLHPHVIYTFLIPHVYKAKKISTALAISQQQTTLPLNSILSSIKSRLSHLDTCICSSETDQHADMHLQLSTYIHSSTRLRRSHASRTRPVEAKRRHNGHPYSTSPSCLNGWLTQDSTSTKPYTTCRYRTSGSKEG